MVRVTLAGIYADRESDKEAALQDEDPELEESISELGKRYEKATNAKFRMASRLFLSNELPVREFSKLSTANISSATSIDFAHNVEASQRINDWLGKALGEQKTHVVEPNELGVGTRGIAISGISVNGHWQHRFESLHKTYFVTRDLAGQVAHSLCVPMMHTFNMFATIATDNARGIFIPFSQADMGMLVLLPLHGIETKDLLDDVQIYFNNAADPPRDMHLFLPIFRVEYDKQLGSFVQGLDIEDLLGEAKFHRNFDQNSNSKINEFKHRTVVHIQPNRPLIEMPETNAIKHDINEEVFDVNQSFVFVIMDRDTVYVAGRIEHLDGLTPKVNCSRKFAESRYHLKKLRKWKSKFLD
ncbi:LOW QUALITY PROTEIN: accessory gland protein Acp76A [Drosophila obscura]|uniref:LOW QUALITY PROTEIN: accessory gland protein Acp76A n=1 Tax=Drosophila obscura TaxID=7282 RepID=UPI001BB0EE50|nr:LOW QUALITY PROTEIN: accessory gland protein Acp76A [Drosophila obscura]